MDDEGTLQSPEMDHFPVDTRSCQGEKRGSLKKLRLAKCSECGRVTSYRPKSLQEITTIQCRRCGTSIPVRAR